MALNYDKISGWVAVASLALSVVIAFQVNFLPLMRSENVQVALPKEFLLTHKFGVVEVEPWVEIRNDGKSADIHDASLFLIDRDNGIQELKVDSYVNRESIEGGYYPWTVMTASSERNWSGRLHFRQQLKDSDEEVFRNLKADFAEEKIKSLPVPPLLYGRGSIEKKLNLNVDRKLEDVNLRVKKFTDDNFKLKHGAYKLAIVLWGGNANILAMRCYEMNIFESALSAIKNSDGGGGEGYLVPSIIDPSNDISLRQSIPLKPIEDAGGVSEIKARLMKVPR